VGFSAEPGTGEVRLVSGMRGGVERNAMRYYLAIESWLGALAAPPPRRFEQASRAWFAATERYRRQLHEMEEAEYLEMKRREHARQAQARAAARSGG
jgi:transposase